MDSNRVVPFNYLSGRSDFSTIRRHTHNLFLTQSHRVHTEKWQGLEISDKPDMVSHELMNYSFTHVLPWQEGLPYWQDDIKPNLPWADDHFEERVCGYPINPGAEWKNWPWGVSADGFRNEIGQFNHNYMERYWSRHAPQAAANTPADYDMEPGYEAPNRGIRDEYGDLYDLVQSLAKNPLSRQEWFPIFHPEDVGEVVGGRKPCSLGYQFWVRDQGLHIYYPMRSCDFHRHMQDDIYLTLRLLLWVLDQCRQLDSLWERIRLGTFTMHCTSLHVFSNDMVQMKKEGMR